MNACTYTYTPPYAFMKVCVINYSDSSTLLLKANLRHKNNHQSGPTLYRDDVAASCENKSYASKYINCDLKRFKGVYQDYIHKVPIILHDNLQRESHKPYGPPTSVTWLQLLHKQTNMAPPPLWLH
jgi:hypothetical protein